MRENPPSNEPYSPKSLLFPSALFGRGFRITWRGCASAPAHLLSVEVIHFFHIHDPRQFTVKFSKHLRHANKAPRTRRLRKHTSWCCVIDLDRRRIIEDPDVVSCQIQVQVRSAAQITNHLNGFIFESIRIRQEANKRNRSRRSLLRKGWRPNCQQSSNCESAHSLPNKSLIHTHLYRARTGSALPLNLKIALVLPVVLTKTGALTRRDNSVNLPLWFNTADSPRNGGIRSPLPKRPRSVVPRV